MHFWLICGSTPSGIRSPNMIPAQPPRYFGFMSGMLEGTFERGLAKFKTLVDKP